MHAPLALPALRFSVDKNALLTFLAATLCVPSIYLARSFPAALDPDRVGRHRWLIELLNTADGWPGFLFFSLCTCSRAGGRPAHFGAS